MNKRELNSIYSELEVSTAVMVRYLDDMAGLNYTVGFYNGHYSKNAQGEYEREFYPIPVISVAGVCDIEIEPDAIAVSSKLKRETALLFDYNALKEYKFEVYGVEDYLADYYVNRDVDKLLENIGNSQEREIAYRFTFGKSSDFKQVARLTLFLRSNGFYY